MSIEDQPPPVHNDLPAVWDLVIQDMQERHQVGIERYGTPLQPFNGRDALVDAYQEKLDDIVYTRQAIYEVEALRDALRGAMEALRLTREYVGEELLPAEPGWSWYDATVEARRVLGDPVPEESTPDGCCGGGCCGIIEP